MQCGPFNYIMKKDD